jgi:hypothetical protein
VSRPDLLVLSLGTTRGLRAADAQFAGLCRDAGATVEVVGTRIGATDALRRAYPVNDIVEALAARRALATALERERPRAVVYSSTTAALLAPDPGVPYAIRFDSPAVLNRPGGASRVLHPLERRRMRAARLLLPFSAVALRLLPAGSGPAVVLPAPLEPSGDPAAERPPVAVAYVPDPRAKGLDIVCGAFGAAAVEGARLDVYGIDPDLAREFLTGAGVELPAAATLRGHVPTAQFRAALREARVLVHGARWEDYGMAPLEALADGALVATTPAGGPYAALPLARDLAGELVATSIDADALATALRAAFAIPEERAAAYRAAALERLAPYRRDALVETLRERVLPALLDGS